MKNYKRVTGNNSQANSFTHFPLLKQSRKLKTFTLQWFFPRTSWEKLVFTPFKKFSFFYVYKKMQGEIKWEFKNSSEVQTIFWYASENIFLLLEIITRKSLPSSSRVWIATITSESTSCKNENFAILRVVEEKEYFSIKAHYNA